MSLEDHPEYDANLFSTGPAPTKVRVQSGCATNLPSDRPKPSSGDDLESGQQKLQKLTPIRNGAKATAGVEPTANIPFYRTERGIIILVIVTIVLLAAIIGGAVPRTQLAKSSAFSVPPYSSLDSTHTTTTSGELGQGVAPTVTATLTTTALNTTLPVAPSVPTGIIRLISSRQS